MKPMQRDIPLTHDHYGRAISKGALRPRCAMCNKFIRLWTKWIDAPREPRTNRPVSGWCYQGNEHVVKCDYDHMLISPDGTEQVERYGYKASEQAFGEYERIDRKREHPGWKYEKRLRRVSVWDGETYLPVDRYFCSEKCARYFARIAYDAGYRTKRSTA